MSPIGRQVKAAQAENPADALPRYAYSQEDLERARAVAEWLQQRDLPRAWLARKAGINGSTISQILAQKYPSPPGALLDQMLQVLAVEGERMEHGSPGYIEGSVHRLVFVVCDRMRKEANLGVLIASVGVGKTRTFKEYLKRRPLTLMVEADPNMTTGRLLDELLQQLRIDPPSGLGRKFAAVLKAIKGTQYLVIADEANNLCPIALHYLRRVRDKAGVGIVLTGNQKLHAMLAPEVGQFQELRSRVSMWPPTIETITRDDMDDIARKTLETLKNADDTAVQATDEVLEALWSYCKGSARTLTESLLPAIRDYGVGRHLVNAKLIDKIASTVCFIKRGDAR
jgi:DNA transposition AAA+ family ATPase